MITTSNGAVLNAPEPAEAHLRSAKSSCWWSENLNTLWVLVLSMYRWKVLEARSNTTLPRYGKAVGSLCDRTEF